MKDNRFVSPPGALKFTNKKARISQKDMDEAEKAFDVVSKQLNATPVDDETLELIRSRKKHSSGNTASVQH